MIGVPYYKIKYKRKGVEAIATISTFDYIRFTNDAALFAKNYPEGLIIGDYPGGNVPYANYETPVSLADARPIFEKKNIKTTGEGYPRVNVALAGENSKAPAKPAPKPKAPKPTPKDENSN